MNDRQQETALNDRSRRGRSEPPRWTICRRTRRAAAATSTVFQSDPRVCPHRSRRQRALRPVDDWRADRGALTALRSLSAYAFSSFAAMKRTTPSSIAMLAASRSLALRPSTSLRQVAALRHASSFVQGEPERPNMKTSSFPGPKGYISLPLSKGRPQADFGLPLSPASPPRLGSASFRTLELMPSSLTTKSPRATTSSTQMETRCSMSLPRLVSLPMLFARQARRV